jgi:hypothetical protein
MSETRQSASLAKIPIGSREMPPEITVHEKIAVPHLIVFSMVSGRLEPIVAAVAMLKVPPANEIISGKTKGNALATIQKDPKVPLASFA